MLNTWIYLNWNTSLDILMYWRGKGALIKMIYYNKDLIRYCEKRCGVYHNIFKNLIVIFWHFTVILICSYEQMR